MPNIGGNNGSVTRVAASPGGTNVVIHYPDPEPDGRDETYMDAADWFVKRCDAAKPPVDKIDVATDMAGTPTTAANHK